MHMLLVKPVSADCNLSCPYCFYRRAGALYPGTARRLMSQDTLERMISLALAAAYPEQAVFCWQGGEPTLAGVDFYRQAFRLMERHGRDGQPVANGLQTNGLLLDAEWARLCAQYQVLVGVSLDGPPDLHDHYRRHAGGGSFQQVMAGIAHLQAAGVEFNILTLVTAASAGRAAEIYAFLRNQGFRYLQFIPCVEAPGDQPAPYTIPAPAYGDFLCQLFDAWRQDGPGLVSVRLFDALLARQLTGRSGLCILDGECSGYLVVEHNGDVFPCDFFVTKQWRLGNLHQSDLAALRRRPRWRQFHALRQANRAACGDCRWRPLCRGGCPKDRLAAGGAAARDYLCQAHQQFFAHALPEITRLAQRLGPQLSPAPP